MLAGTVVEDDQNDLVRKCRMGNFRIPHALKTVISDCHRMGLAEVQDDLLSGSTEAEL